MDTRSKILDWPRARQLVRQRLDSNAAPIVVTGHFDPMLAPHANRLAEIASQARGVVVIVTDPERPLLPADARAELVAALEAVEAVTLAAPDTEQFLQSLPVANVIREEASDASRALAFAQHVRGRQAAV